MKKIFMLLLMAVAAVSAWGQEDAESNETYKDETRSSYNKYLYEKYYKDMPLKQRYIRFLFGESDNETFEETLEFTRNHFPGVEDYIYDTQNGVIISMRILPKEEVLAEYQKHLLSLRRYARRKDRIGTDDNALNSHIFENELSVPSSNKDFIDMGTIVKI